MKAQPIPIATRAALAVTLTAIGLLLVPRLLKKAESKVYRASAGNAGVNIDDLGPEIVRKDGREAADNG